MYVTVILSVIAKRQDSYSVVIETPIRIQISSRYVQRSQPYPTASRTPIYRP